MSRQEPYPTEVTLLAVLDVTPWFCQHRRMPPGYRPSDLLHHPADFGYATNAPWKNTPETDEAQLAVAKLQHRLACVIRNNHPGHTARYLAQQLGEPERVDYLRRKLSGQIPITLTELFEWLHALGPETAVAIGINPKLVFP